MFKEILDYVNPFHHKKSVQTSGFVFKCLTCFTVNILSACVLIISMRQFFGEPIKCIGDKSDYVSYMETKCWIEGVYLEPSLFNYTEQQAIAVGVGTPRYRGSGGEQPQLIYHNYYQWVIPVLALQAFLLYLPRILWHTWENGVMEKILSNSDSPIMTDEWSKQLTTILKFLRVKKRIHHTYVIKYLICEISAYAILIFNMKTLQWVFNNFWTEFTPAIGSLMSQNTTQFARFSARIFPHQAKCSLEVYGSSGSIQFIDGLCFLSQNNINEKVFVFLYFWYIFAAIFGTINLIRLFAMFGFKFMRAQDVRRMASCNHTRRSDEICYWCSDFGIWHVLRVIHRNLSPVLFEDFIKALMKCDDVKSLDSSLSSEELDINVDKKVIQNPA